MKKQESKHIGADEPTPNNGGEIMTLEQEANLYASSFPIEVQVRMAEGYIDGWKNCESQFKQKLEQSEQRVKELEQAENLLAALTDLKYIKDTQGKTDFYLNKQPKVWKDVHEYVKTLNK